MNKKYLSLICVLLFICIITACNQQHDISINLYTAKSNSDKIIDSTNQADIKYISSLNLGTSEKGYYFTTAMNNNGLNICFLDFKTNQTIFLCSNAECQHTDSACTSWIGNPYNTPRIIPIEDKILLVFPGNYSKSEINKDDLFPRVEIMDENGYNRKVLVKYTSNIMFADFYALTNDELICQLDVYDSKGIKNKTSRVEKINLKTGTTVEIKNFGEENIFFLGALKDKMFVKKIIIDNSISDARRRLEGQTHQIFSFSLSDNKTVNIAEWKQDVKQELFSEDNMFYTDKTLKIGCINLNNGKDEELVSSAVFTDYFSAKYNIDDYKISTQLLLHSEDYLICKITLVSSTPEDTKDMIVIINIKTKQIVEVSKNTLYSNDKLPLSIRAVKNDVLVCVSEYNPIESTFVDEDGTVYPYSFMQPKYQSIKIAELMN